ncbi:MAG: SMP-30/gluconolactonase/LRE family protein, partial [Proteobacteria bacterium]|nr:SMP-30/gluconolactonase/LRE family protein [Pseudomonadota bacterium]
MANNFDIKPAVDIEGTFPIQCECRECESAVSPLAYLTDLLDYTITHVKKNTGYSIDLNTLEEELHQPFKRYIAACEEVDRKVRQVRVCIEVLRSHLKDDSPYPSYLFEAYKTLLNRIGTTYDEIRLARTADPNKREALANRLGIDLSEERPDELDALFLTSENITLEQTLEKLFGLVDTTRDPLSDGAKIPDFLSWRLKHLRTLWKEQDWPGDPYTQRIMPIIDPDVINPDDFRLTEQNESVFELWKERREWVDKTMEQLDRDRKINGLDHILGYTLKLALGGDPLPDLDALLKNLRKGENLEDTEDQIRSMNLTVERFTRLMVIRAKHIRAENNYESEAVNNEEWREVYSILIQAGKKIVYAYCIAEEQEKHVNLGPKQFWISLRQPKEGDWPPAHLAQQPVIDPELLNVEELPEPLAGGYAVVIWEARRARLDQIYEKLKAEQEERGFVAMLKLAVGDPEPGDDLLHDLDNLEENLHSTDPEVVATAKWNITNGLHMTVIAFRRLMSIKAKADNPDSEPTDEEWAEVYAINTSAFKLKREYPNWISQEEKLPLIDHDVLELSDLTEPTIGKRAIALWHARQAKVDRTYENLKDTSETEGLDTMLREALGEPDPGNPLPHNLAELNENLKSGDSERVNEATIKITNDLFMTVNDFTRLMEIKDKYADPNTLEKPAEKEWAEVTTILTQAQKAKREYPNWKEEEQDNDIVFWSALKAKLPRWLASQEARQQWLQALRNRSQAPIIDPDVIGEDDLKNLIDDDPAYEILEARRNWVRDQLDALEMAATWLSWGNEGTGNGQFEKPQGVAIDSSGNVYVADSNNHRIQKFDPWGEVIDVWGGPEDGQFEKPQGVAVDSSGNVYVVDTENHRIQKFDSDGRLLKQWGEEGSEKGEFKRPSGAAVDVNSGDVYVADTKNHRIQKFDSDGGFIREWGEEGNRKGAFKNPRGVAVDSRGRVYVADSENHRIQKFNPDGNPIAVLGQEEGNGDGEFSWPLGVAVDSSGNVYVADSNNHRIQKFDSDGRFLMQWGCQGSEDG